MNIELLKELNVERAKRRAVIVLTDTDKGAFKLIKQSQSQTGELGEEVKRAFLTGKSRTIEYEGREVFLNVYLPPTRLVAIGAVHITQHLAAITSASGYDLEIIDPRSAFATPERFAGATLYDDWPLTVLEERPLDPYCALIAVTHDPKIDDDAIVAGLLAGCFYVGALGSRKTHAKRLQRLGEHGLNSAQLDKIHAPIGLDIAAANPAEIAVAILAQVIERFRRRGLG